jgi:hypothetical protein
MNQTLKRWLLQKLDSIHYKFTATTQRLRERYDLCEVCKANESDSICVGCQRRICCECDSRYYYDVELCKRCRADITPEEEEQDRREALEYMAENEE